MLNFLVPKAYVIYRPDGRPYYTFEMGFFYRIEDPRYQLENIIYDFFKKMVLKRDNYTCRHQDDGECSPILQVHHLRTVLTHPHILFDIDNCVVLCKTHHENLHEQRQERWDASQSFDGDPDEWVLCDICGNNYHKGNYRMCYGCYMSTTGRE